VIVVARKWLVGDERWTGVSDADRAALEVALRLAEAFGDTVTAVTVGGPPAERAVREAVAAGATRAVRVDAPNGLNSAQVAAAIADVASGARWLVCGDASADRGSGAVPAYLAAELGTAQALGLIEITADGDDVRAVRRLDGGRREVLAVRPPAVLSVEGSVARLRRVGLDAELAARSASVEVLPGPRGPVDEPALVSPYRPRPRALAVPHGDALDRVRTLTALGTQPTGRGEHVVLEPPAAAARILAALEEWGYLAAGAAAEGQVPSPRCG
jgi:electron transfer flavoprotein beta subunit